MTTEGVNLISVVYGYQIEKTKLTTNLGGWVLMPIRARYCAYLVHFCDCDVFQVYEKICIKALLVEIKRGGLKMRTKIQTADSQSVFFFFSSVEYHHGRTTLG